MSVLLHIAPANSVHSFKWIDFHQDKVEKNFFFSFYEIEKGFLTNFPNVKPVSFAITRFRIINFILMWLMASFVILFNRKVVVNSQSAGIHGLLASVLPTRRLVTTVWGSDILILAKKPLIGILVRFILWRSRFVTCDALHMVNELNRYMNDSDKVKIINFGVDTNKLKKIDSNECEFYWSKYGIDNRKKIILSMRNHYPVYDIETLIKASVKLNDVDDLMFVVAGRGELTESYKNLARELSVSDRFIFSGGYISSELPLMFASTFLYVSTSLSDAGIAASTAEAMSCQVPVLISDSGENNLWIDHEVNGYLFKTGDCYELANQIRKIVAINPDELRKIGSNGRAKILESNDYHNEMKKVAILYESLA